MKHTKTMARLLVCLLALCMVVGTFVACDNDKTDPDSTKATTTSGGDKIAPPEVVNIGRTVKMLGWGNEDGSGYATQYCGEENSQNAVFQTIWERNETMEELMNFEYDWTYAPGDWSVRKDFMQLIKSANETVGGGNYDGVVTYNLNPYMFAYNGLAENIYGHKYLDLSKPWWPQTLNNEILVNGTLYALVENNDYGVLRNIMAMFFNNDLIEKKNLEDPYTLVENNEWTIAKLSEMVKGTYEDKNGNTTIDKDVDLFGFCGATNAKRDCWFYSLGNRYTEVQDGVIVDLCSDPNGKIQTFIETMREFYSINDVMQIDSTQDKMFKESRAIFYSTGLFITEEIVNEELEINYGVVPMPKLNSAQPAFYTMTHNTHDAWMVPINCSNIDEMCAIMEYSSYLAYENIGPMYFDTYVKLRYAPDERLSAMYDLVRESIVFDFGYLFKATYDTAPASAVSKAIQDLNGDSWTTIYGQYKNQWDAALAEFAGMYSSEVNG